MGCPSVACLGKFHFCFHWLEQFPQPNLQLGEVKPQQQTALVQSLSFLVPPLASKTPGREEFMHIYCCICGEGPAQLCAKPGFAPPASSGSSPGWHGGKVNRGMLLYFSLWLSPSAANGCGWEDSMWALPHVETFGLSLPMLAACKSSPPRCSMG